MCNNSHGKKVILAKSLNPFGTLFGTLALIIAQISA